MLEPFGFVSTSQKATTAVCGATKFRSELTQHYVLTTAMYQNPRKAKKRNGLCLTSSAFFLQMAGRRLVSCDLLSVLDQPSAWGQP